MAAHNLAPPGERSGPHPPARAASDVDTGTPASAPSAAIVEGRGAVADVGLYDWAPADLLTFIRRVVSEGSVPNEDARALIRVALDSESATGRNVVQNCAAIAAEFGVSDRTVRRRLEPYLGTWLRQTAKPTRGVRGEPGRRARYRLWVPKNRGTEPNGDMAHESGIVGQIRGNRGTDSGESWDTTQREPVTVSTSVGPTSVGPHAPVRVRDLLADVGVADDETEDVVDFIKARHPKVHNLARWLTTLGRSGDLAALVAEARGRRAKTAWPAERDEFTAALSELPPCPHGEPGGSVPKPDGHNPGWMACVGCRIDAGWLP